MKLRFILLSLNIFLTIFLISCGKPKNSKIILDKTEFRIDEPLMLKISGTDENWVGLFGEDDADPIFWDYAKNHPNFEAFDLLKTNLGIYHNGFEDLVNEKYYLKWFEKSLDSVNKANEEVAITFTYPDLVKPISVNYDFRDLNSGYADGKLQIKVGKSLVEKASISMFWGTESGKLADYNSFSKFEITGETFTYEMPKHILIPEAATHLYLYTSRFNKLSKEALVYELPKNLKKKKFGKVLGSYTICSDTQIGTSSDGSELGHLDALFQDIASKKYQTEGIFMNGDIVDHGYVNEYESFFKHYEKYALPRVYFAIGNHELKPGINEEAIQELEALFLKYTTLPDGTHPASMHYDFWLKGYHFIFLGNDKLPGSEAINLNDDTLNWFQKTLEKDYDKKRPCFIFLHQPLKDTVAGSLTGQGWNGVFEETEVKLREILKDYHEAILFTGHTHWTLDSFQNIYADDLNLPRCVNTGAIAYEWTTYGNTYGRGVWKTGAEGYVMEIYEDMVVLRGRDYLFGKWLPSSFYGFQY